MGNPNLTVDPEAIFEPAMYSTPELHWLGAHLKEEPIIAFQRFNPEPGVFRSRVEPLLRRVHELQTLADKAGIPWAGYDALLESIERYLAWLDLSERIRAAGGPPYPSMYEWDSLGRATKFAVGTDGCEMVKTEILEDGSRRPFGVKLAPSTEERMGITLGDIAPWTKAKARDQKDEVSDEAVGEGHTRRFSCSICGHADEYQADEPATRRAAWARMGTHLKKPKKDVNQHRTLYTRTFK